MGHFVTQDLCAVCILRFSAYFFIKIFKCFDVEEPTDPHREIDGEADTHNFEEQGSSNPSDGDTDALKAKYLLHLNVIIIR